MQLLATINDINEWLLRLPQQKIAKMISVLLLGYIAYVLAQLTWLLVSTKSPNVNILPTTTHSFSATSAAKIPVFVDTKRLEALHLFGIYQKQQKIEPVRVQDAPETNLKLILTGTVASSDQAIAAAVIENNAKQETYGIGDKIVGTRATLESVSTDRVLIKQSGRLETLMLDGFKYKKADKTIARKSDPIKQVNSNDDDQLKAKVLDQRNNSALSQAVKLVKADISNDPKKIMEYLRISPKREAGKVIGYRLMPGREPAFFQSSGLQSGDVAVAINGLDLSIPSEAAQALKALNEQQELSLLIDRNGEITEILFSINNEL